MLGARLATGLSLVALFLAVLWLDEWMAPVYPLWLIITALITSLAALEMVEMLAVVLARPSRNTVLGGTLAVLLANWGPHLAGWWFADHRQIGPAFYDPSVPTQALAWPLWAFAGVLMAAFVAQSAQFGRPGSTMARIAGTTLAVAYVGLLGSFIVQLRWIDGPHHGVIPLMFLVAASKGADTGAYTFGRLAGRHKLWPRLSPNKTVEGALGGLAAGVVFSLLIEAVARFTLGASGLSWGAAVGFGLVVGAAAQLGDLMESMIKRDCARKDASATLPGFGGVLDVLDSLLFAGPVGYGFWLIFGR